jgi:uncharacterized protein (DUF4415 family)
VFLQEHRIQNRMYYYAEESMTREQQLSKARPNGRGSARRTAALQPTDRQRSSSRARTATQPAAGKKHRSRPLTLAAAAEDRKRGHVAIADPEYYRPLKKPVTLRLDADVLAWFKREGRRYQTRINQALRQVMEKEVGSGR